MLISISNIVILYFDMYFDSIQIMFLRDDNSKSYKILNWLGQAVYFLIFKPIGAIFAYIGKLLSDVAKSAHGKLVNWLGYIVLLVIVSVLIHFLK